MKEEFTLADEKIRKLYEEYDKACKEWYIEF